MEGEVTPGDDYLGRYAELVVGVGANVQPEWLGRTPEHVLAGIRSWAQDQPAVIRLTGNPAPQLFSDLDPARVAALAPKARPRPPSRC